MIALPSSVRIYLAAGAVDLRKSIDGLLTASINELQRRVAELIVKAYGLQLSAKPDDSRVADKSTQDWTLRRRELEDVLDDLRDSGERADAFANAAKDLVEGLAAKEKCDNPQWTKL